MNEDYKSIEPGFDLGLGSSYTGQYIQGRFTNKSGVGANVGSMVDIKYLTTDSLSELVWSPHKGLSLRYADSSFNNRKGSILWDAGANNASFAMPRSITAEKSTSNNLLDNRTIIMSQAESHLKKNIADGKQVSNRTSSGDAGYITSKVKVHARDKGVESYENETDRRAEAFVVHFKQEDLQETGGVDITDAGNIPMNKLSTIGKNNCSSLPENDLQNMNDKTTGCEGRKMMVTDSSHEVRGSNQQDKKKHLQRSG